MGRCFSVHRLLMLAVALSLGPWLSVAASETGEVEQRRSDLEEVRRRIRDLQKEIADTEESRSSAAEELAAAERAVSRVQRALQAAARSRQEAEQALSRLVEAQQAVEARIAGRQDELAGWLRRHYMHGAGGVAPLLSARDPNQIARDAFYLELLGKARLQLIEDLRADLREKGRVMGEIAARRDRLLALETEQQARRAELEAMKAKRSEVVAGFAEQLRSQRKEVSDLKKDQERLGRLVALLAKRAAEREAARAAAAARAAREAERVARDAERPRGAEPERGSARARQEPVVGQAKQTSGPTPTGLSFADLRGRMRFPVRGELIGRFGAQRAEGGTTWRGVFIRAPGGAEVRAVAGGEVVFSDWLRGYGNLIILDHGSDYLTIYGNNDALLREVGDNIAGGDPIASVGASRGDGESGLYFEIRHRGQPLDPLKWVQAN